MHSAISIFKFLQIVKLQTQVSSHKDNLYYDSESLSLRLKINVISHSLLPKLKLFCNFSIYNRGGQAYSDVILATL